MTLNNHKDSLFIPSDKHQEATPTRRLWMQANIGKLERQSNPLYSAIKLNHKKQSINFLTLKLFLLFNLVGSSQQALLTNIYGKRLSELEGDLSHRFLLIPSPFAATQNPQQHSESTPVQQHEQVLAQSRLARTIAFDNSSGSKSAKSPAEPMPSPLALAWKQQGSSASPAQQRSLRLMMQNSSLTGDLQQPRVPLGEPQVLESVSTEFPNPNINNLGHEITKILRKFFLHGYDKRVRPNYSGPPALVNVSFHIIGISSVDEVQMDFTTDFYFRQKWFDPRLEFDPVGEIDELCVGAEFAEKIWLPDTFFANEKTATFHKATTENTFIRIGNNGRVYRSIRLTVTCSCPMDLQYFPMDRQRCKIEIESYGYNTRDIDYRWERGDASVSLNTKIELPQFKILGFKMGQEIQNLSSGDYIRLYCEIHFVRSMGYYLFQIYIPASLIVMISWVSFWLHRNATPARVALGVTTVLTMTTLMSSTNAALPKISYIKSIDVFLGTCFVMVFAALLEYASVGYIGKRIAMKRKRLQDLQQMQQHHQKVCVAAAASAAAAAAAAGHEGHNFSPGAASEASGAPWATRFGGGALAAEHGSAHTLGRRSTTIGAKLMGNGSKTIRRLRATSSGQAVDGQATMGVSHDSNAHGEQQRSSIKVLLGGNQNGQQQSNPMNGRDSTAAMNSSPQAHQKRSSGARFMSHLPFGGATQSIQAEANPNDPSRTPLLAAGAAIAAAAAANQHSHGPTTEFEVNQTHDMIRICGLTPSAIDKHSRVVFPICFVCFNLMYWIIYGHISQQIEDKGPPLIPFIKA